MSGLMFTLSDLRFSPCSAIELSVLDHIVFTFGVSILSCQKTHNYFRLDVRYLGILTSPLTCDYAMDYTLLSTTELRMRENIVFAFDIYFYHIHAQATMKLIFIASFRTDPEFMAAISN